MLEIVLVLLIVLWILGFIQLPFVVPDPVLFSIMGNPISLLDVLIFLIIIWAIGVLPSPIREIAGVIFLLWILSVLGILAISGLSSILLLGIMLGIIIALFNR